jgi:hypothetical protein
MIVVKLFASLLLCVCLLVGIRKANKNNHKHDYRPIAEYLSGFIFAVGAIVGFYYLWW